MPIPLLPSPRDLAPAQSEQLVGEPGEASAEAVTGLVAAAQRQRSDPRRSAQAQRERILRSRHHNDIVHRINGIYAPAFAHKVASHVTVTANPFEDVVSGVLQLYRGGAVRRIQDASESEQEAFHALTVESGIEALGQGWAEMAYASGPQFVVPTIRRERLRLLAPQPSDSDAVLDIEDPTGPPVAVAYRVGRAAHGGARVAVVDAVSTRFFDPRGGEAVELTDLRRDHELDDIPVATLRFWEAESDDWFGYDRNQRLVDGALTVGHLAAKLRHVRKAQGGKLLTITGNVDGMAKGQTIGDPDGPIVARSGGESADDTRTTEIDALDFDTNPAYALAHIRAEIEWMAESTGVPVEVSSLGSTTGSQWDYSWDHDALAELRKSLLWWAIMWERQLWFAAVSMAKKMRHPLASKLPDPRKVAEGFTLSLPPLHRKFSDPLAEQKWWEWMLKHGQASVLDLSRRYHGQLSDKGHTKAIFDRMALNVSFWDMVASRNQPTGLDGDTPPAAVAGPDGIKTAAQAQGALGPAVRDGKAPPPDGGNKTSRPG